MARTGVLYESRGGQTEKIARHMAEVVRERVADVQIVDVEDLPAGFDLEELDSVIIGAPICFSRHTGGVTAFIRNHQEILSLRPSFSCSVSLNAKTELQHKGAAQGYATALLAPTDWTPKATATFAGALRYLDYNWFIRFMMKCIAAGHGSDTDTSRNYEYTKWDLVDEFAREFAGPPGGR